MKSLIYRVLNTLKPTSASTKRLVPARSIGSSLIASIRCDGTARQPQGAPERKKDSEGGKRTKGNNRSMKLTIAVEGCCHGELDKIYATLQLLEKREGKKIDLLLCCGDFQAVRNLDDLETMACPPKYRSMGTFYKYYTGERTAPFPTIFIGGNHEAANHLWELYYGGWAAPNIYFLGFTGAVKFGGLRIAGMSGIYKQHDYRRGHHESLPYSDSTIRSLYHIRDFEVYRLLQLQEPVDIFLSHDWPNGITRYGNEAWLLSRKAHFRSEVESGTLGSLPGAQLLEALRPAYWFAAHMHVKFAAVVQHSRPSAASPQLNAAAVRLATGQTVDGEAGPGPDGAAERGGGGGGGGNGAGSLAGFPSTRFLALDKCLPGRNFLQVIEVDAPGPPELHYDEEWLAILRTTHQLTNLDFKHSALPGMGGLRSGPRSEDLEFVRQALAARGTTRVPDNFTTTAAPYNPALGQRSGRIPTHHMRNPQTVAFMDLLGLPYNLDHMDRVGRGAAASGPSSSGRVPMSLTGQGPAMQQPRPFSQRAPVPLNPEEIDLGDLDEDIEEAT